MLQTFAGTVGLSANNSFTIGNEGSINFVVDGAVSSVGLLFFLKPILMGAHGETAELRYIS